MDKNDAFKVDDVFGINRNSPLNYIEREGVDSKLRENLTRGKHINIYGGSKQGKTSLRKHCLQEGDYILIQCSNKWDLSALHENILKRAGFEITHSTKKTLGGSQKLVASFKAAFMGLGTTLSGTEEKKDSTEQTTAPIELDPEDVNDVISALKSIKLNAFIVLEDFHYLPIETQKDFSVALKAFHEASNYCFIIVGVWLDENRLIVHNGDLTGRVIAINADKWNKDDLHRVITGGKKLLKIKFSNEFRTALVKNSFDSVYIVQEVCNQACRANNVFETLEKETIIGRGLNVRSLIEDAIAQQSGRYDSFIYNFCDGFQQTELNMHRWLLFSVISSDLEELSRGLSWGYLKKIIQASHPLGENLNTGNLTQALQSTASL